jgi:hypothetical protein
VEAKAHISLQGEPKSEDLILALRSLCEGNYTKAATQSAQIMLASGDDECQGQSTFAMALLTAAVARAWSHDDKTPVQQKDSQKDAKDVPKASSKDAKKDAQKEGTQEESPIAAVLASRPSKTLNKVIAAKRGSLAGFGFMLRAMPPFRLPEQASATDLSEDIREAAEQETSNADAAGTNIQNKLDGEASLAEHPECLALAEMELVQTGPWLRELCQISFHAHDVSSFKYFDLDQVAVPELSDESSAAPGETNQSLAGTLGFQESEVTDEPDKWDQREADDKANREVAFGLLHKCLHSLVRAASYSAAKKSDQLLQAVLLAALNALIIAGPSPAQCVPPGPKSNPLDVDPDGHVGIPPSSSGKQTESAEVPPAATQVQTADHDAGQAMMPPGATAEVGGMNNAVWLDLAFLAELAIGMLRRLKQKHSLPGALTSSARRDEETSTPAINQAVNAENPDGDNLPHATEEQQIRIATQAREVLESTDEELQDIWFEKLPELDIENIATLVAFAVLCLFHMRRWDTIMRLCRDFDAVTCSVFAATFLPLMIGAQKEVCKLSSMAIVNTERYIKEAEAIFQTDQEGLSRKVLLHLRLSGEKSEPQLRFEAQSHYYKGMLRRQSQLHAAWEELLVSMKRTHSLVERPAAMDQLRKSRLLLTEFLLEKRALSMHIDRGRMQEPFRKRTLSIKYSALVSSYRKAVELLRKRKTSDQVVQALHELGNLLWLEGDRAGAQSAWSDAVDTTFNFVQAIKNWRQCAETSIAPPQNASRAETMLLAVLALAKYAKFGVPNDAGLQLNATLLASSIVEVVLTSALPHPSQRMLFAPDMYRLREICHGLRQSRSVRFEPGRRGNPETRQRAQRWKSELVQDWRGGQGVGRHARVPHGVSGGNLREDHQAFRWGEGNLGAHDFGCPHLIKETRGCTAGAEPLGFHGGIVLVLSVILSSLHFSQCSNFRAYHS